MYTDLEVGLLRSSFKFAPNYCKTILSLEIIFVLDVFFKYNWHMLKNIVFDLGNVLVKFDSNELIYHFFNARQEEVKSFYFDSLWDEYDQGLYSVEEMIEKGVKQF